ncbi:unnamed protein product [Schistosoma rodhaini]|uniref:Protein-tyrosine-phosphatase n=1 Tax=Schistosoma rodhaini TaxID=6188 RepID=A0AA85G9V0_9TREM|nr:unnamed protein product [Schistosoma rodhaini]
MSCIHVVTFLESSFNVAVSASNPVGSTFNQGFTYGVTDAAPDVSTNSTITASATTNFTTTTDGFNQSKSSFNVAVSASNPVGSTFNQGFTYGVTDAAPDVSTNSTITASATTNFTTTTDGFNQSKSSFNVAVSASNPVGSTFNQGFTYGVTDAAPDVSTNSTITASATTNFTTTTDGFNQSKSSFNVAVSASNPVGSTFNQGFTYGVTDAAPDVSTNSTITASATTNFTTTTDGFNQSKSSFNVAVSASNPVGSTFNQGFTYGVTDAAPDVSTNSTITASATTNFTTTTDGFNQSKSSFNVAVSASNPVGSTFNQGFTYGVTDAAPDVSTNSTITASATTNFTTTTDGFNQSKSSFNVAVSASNPVGSTFNQGFTYGVTDAAPDVSTNSTITASATTNFTTTTDGFNQSKSSFNVAVSASNPVGSTFNQGFTYGVTDAAPDVSTNSTITASATTNFTTTTDGFNQSKSSFNVAVSASNPVGSTFNQGFTYGVTDAAPDVSTNSTITASATTNFTTTTDEFNQSIQLLNTSIHTPKLIQISNITSTSFVIIWPVVKTNGSQFRVSTYEISLNSQRQSLLLIKNISSEVFREKIENLTACTIYTIQMRLVIKQYETVCSEWSKPLTVFTSISTPNPPVNVTFIETRSTQLRVVWMPPEENSAFNINCFLVYIRPTFTVFGHFQKFNICHSNVCDIKSLCPGVNYTVYVESFDSTYGIRSLPSNYITAVTYPDRPIKPENVTVTNIKPNQFTIRWNEIKQDLTFTNICCSLYVRPTLNINDNFHQFNICNRKSEFTVTSLLPRTNYTVYLKSFDTKYGIYSNATKSILIYTTYPPCIQPPVNLTISEINIYGFTVHWDNALEDHLLDNNNNYYYVFIKPLHNHTNKPIQFNAGQSATSFRIFSLSPDTWYSVSVQCTDTTYHISIKSEEIFVHTYSETVERDSLNHLTNLILHVPPEQQTTHIKQDSMIILYLPLSRLNYFISTVYVVSLVIKPTRESHDDEIICSEGCTRKMHYNDITDIYLVESTYKNRHNKENGSWEILIHSRLILSQARARRSMDYKMNGSYLYSDKYFIIGENGVCLYNSHECNGPLKPATQYSIQLRTYTEFGYTTSKIIHGHTLTDTTIILITCCILWSLFILAISSFALLYYRLIERSIIPKNNNIHNNNARRKINSKTIFNGDICSQNIMNRPTPVTTSKFMAQYENYSKDSFAALKAQYQLIISNSQFLIQSDMLSQEIGQRNTNKRLNRFSDILPYDQTRVKLKPLQKTKQDHDYVNASFIYEIIPCASVYTHPVLNRNKIAYIASQAPLESTVGDFWRMVLDQNITIIVMLTKLYEDNISKCCQYWPNDIHESLTFQSDYLKLEVTLLSEEDHHIYILRKLYITSINYQSNNPENSKYVVQFHMMTWPDFDVPKLSEFQTLMKDYRELKCGESHRYSPTLVHCTSNIYFFISLLIHYFDDISFTENINNFGIICLLQIRLIIVILKNFPYSIPGSRYILLMSI